MFIPLVGGLQSTKIIPESDIYRLIFRSKLPTAEQFEDWVTKEVSPSIRKTGKYELLELKDLSEKEKRKVIKEQVISHNKNLVSEAKRLGVGNTKDVNKNQKDEANKIHYLVGKKLEKRCFLFIILHQKIYPYMKKLK